MATRREWDRGRESVLILLLVWAAGSVDALSYIALGHVFTANMTGNMVLLGLSLGQAQVLAALRSVSALVGFGLGVAAGAFIVARKRAEGSGWTRATTWAVYVELAVLACFTAGWHLSGLRRGAFLHLLIGLSAAAMGIQSAMVRHLGVPGIATTYITGTLTTLISNLVAGAKPEDQRVSDNQWSRRTALQASVFAVYGLSAVFNGVVQQRWPSFVAISPLLALIVVVAGARPLVRAQRPTLTKAA